MFHAKGEKPRIALNSPLIKTSKMKKKIKAKTIHLFSDSTPKTTMLKNKRSKNKSHTLELMILFFPSSIAKK
jgi:hypothetical protein